MVNHFVKSKVKYELSLSNSKPTENFSNQRMPIVQQFSYFNTKDGKSYPSIPGYFACSVFLVIF